MTEKQAIDTIWEYLQMPVRSLKEADIILAFGTHDIRVAQKAAEVYKQGYADKIVVSGGVEHPSELYGFEAGGVMTEAQAFRKVLIALDVCNNDIIVEDTAQNTGQNVVQVSKLLTALDVHPKIFIIIQRPHMGRRVYATFMKQWPGHIEHIAVVSSGENFENYIEGLKSNNCPISREHIIHSVLGNLERIRDYPAKGFQIPQEIPDKVHEALAFLKEVYPIR